MDIGSIGSIVASGMKAMRTKADVHAHNLANARTPGYERLDARTTERSAGGVDLLVERDPGPGSPPYVGVGAAQPSPADDPASAGSSSPTDSGLPASSSGPEARGAFDPSNPAGNHPSVEVSNVDPVEEILGLQESVRSMSLLAAVYQRADQAMGTMFDAFG